MKRAGKFLARDGFGRPGPTHRSSAKSKGDESRDHADGNAREVSTQLDGGIQTQKTANVSITSVAILPGRK